MESRPHQSSLRRGRVSISGQIYLITSVTVGRQRFFENFDAACSAARCYQSRAVLAWVLMPDHVHWLVQLEHAEKLDVIVARLKGASAHAANVVLRRSGPLWQRAYHDRALRRDEDVRTAARYLVANPIRAGLVERIGDYPFWDPVWLDT